MVIPVYDSDTEPQEVQTKKTCTKETNYGAEPPPPSFTPINLFSSKDLVGNSKRFRIENNKQNLRIIGNNNQVKIESNYGRIQIIGNNTKLKILHNQGPIKYTGNDGRICLGNKSQQQSVDYIGCNGTLKIFNASDLDSNANTTKENGENGENMKSKKSQLNFSLNQNHCSPPKNYKKQFYTYSGVPSTSLNHLIVKDDATIYMKSFQSAPNLNLNLNLKDCNRQMPAAFKCQHQEFPKHFQISNNLNLVNSQGGGLYISNQVNIKI